MKIQRALISVSDKTGILELAKELAAHGVEILSTGGTAKALQAAGKNPFKHLHLPQAAVALRQGAGRLIRRESDRGVLVVCDARLAQAAYGKQLRAALPPMRRLENWADCLQELAGLTTPSTTDPAASCLPW